jgi:hypothetical protein
MLTKTKACAANKFHSLSEKKFYIVIGVLSKLNHLAIPFTNVNNHANIFSEMLVFYT